MKYNLILLGMTAMLTLALSSCSESVPLTEEDARAAEHVSEISDMLSDSIWQDDATGAIYAFVEDGSLGVFLSDGTQFEGSYTVSAADSTSPPVIDMSIPDLMSKSVQRVVSDVEDGAIIYSDPGSTLSRVSD